MKGAEDAPKTLVLPTNTISTVAGTLSADRNWFKNWNRGKEKLRYENVSFLRRYKINIQRLRLKFQDIFFPIETTNKWCIKSECANEIG